MLMKRVEETGDHIMVFTCPGKGEIVEDLNNISYGSAIKLDLLCVIMFNVDVL